MTEISPLNGPKLMKKLTIVLVAVIIALAGHKAHAACTGVTGGGAASVITAAVTACNSAGGGVITVGAGTYGPFTSAFTLPCNVSLAGPTVTYNNTTHYQTAIFQGSSSFAGVPIHTTAGCSVSQNISYLEWNGEQSSGNGGFIFISAGTANLTIDHNWMHGATGPAYPGNTNEAQVYFGGTGGNISTPTHDVTISMNEFGPEGSAADCGAAMTEQDTEGGGGFCAGILFNGYVKNINVYNNNFHYLEQGMKVVEATTNGGSTRNSGNTWGLNVFYNSFSQIQRIPFETQSNYYTTAFPTLQTIHWNLLGNRYNGNGGQQNFDFSIANGCGNPPATALCTFDADFNSDIQNVNNSVHGAGNEMWGDGNSHANYWLMQGYVAGAGGGFMVAQSGQFKFNNNIFNITSGTGTNCVTQGGGYWNHEDSPVGTWTCTGNTYSNTGTGTYASATPTITPSGTFTGTQTVALTNTGTNLNANTSIWYTTDGTTPVPGTATFYTAPFTVSALTTVKAVGMWGALNQPYSYPSNYGWVPSAVVSATYTPTSGSPTIVSGYLSTSPTNGVNTATVGAATVQFIPVANLSDGTMNSPISPSACTWSTLSGGSAVFSMSSAGVLTPVAAGTDNVIATCSSIAFSQWGVQVTAAPPGPGLVSIFLTPSAIYSSLTSSISAIGVFTDGSQSPVSATWVSSNLKVATIDSTGTLSPLGVGTTLVTATSSGFMAQATVTVPPTTINPNTMVRSLFPFSSSILGCAIFPNLAPGTYTMVINADGSFTLTQ